MLFVGSCGPVASNRPRRTERGIERAARPNRGRLFQLLLAAIGVGEKKGGHPKVPPILSRSAEGYFLNCAVSVECSIARVELLPPLRIVLTVSK